MARSELPAGEAALLVRALGLLLNQTGVYGATHQVTQSALRSVYAEVQQAVTQFGELEFSLHGEQILLNGSANGIDVVAGRNLRDKMRLYHLGNLTFLSPLGFEDFSSCVKLFARPPAEILAQGGMEKMLRGLNLQSVKVTAVTYQRVAGESPPLPDVKTGTLTEKSSSAASLRAAGGIGVFDLSEELEDQSEPGAAFIEADASEQQQRETRDQKSKVLATLLREAAAIFEQNSALGEQGVSQEQLTQALHKVHGALAQLTTDSKQNITTLADQVDEDRQAINSIESAARRRGIGLKLTRGELIERYAELNQEIMQPLTVSSGVIDMLHAGKGGALTDTQQELLELASESVKRVNQLVAYMSRIAGLPDSYTPDTAVISESYR